MTTTSPPSANGVTPLPNRAARRQRAGGGGRPGAGSHIPVRIAGAYGAEVTLAGEPYHLAVLTAFGAEAAQSWFEELDSKYYPHPSATPGGTLVSGFIRNRAWDVLREALGWCIAEELPSDIEKVAQPAEMGAVLDAAWASWHMDWLGAIIKNLATRAAHGMEALFGALADPEMTNRLVTVLAELRKQTPTGTDAPPLPSPPSPSTLAEPADL